MKARATGSVSPPHAGGGRSPTGYVRVAGEHNAIEGRGEIARESLSITIHGNHNRIRIEPKLRCPHGVHWHVSGDHNSIVIGAGFRNQSVRDWRVEGDRNSIVVGGDVRLFSHGSIDIRGDRNRVRIGDNADVAPGIEMHSHDSVIDIGRDTTMFGCWLRIRERGRIEIGEDCMLSSGVSMASSDMHAMYDIETDRRVNPPGNIRLGDHVWLGQNVQVLKGVGIGNGSIIGARTVVSRDVAENVAVAGQDGRVVREKVYWDRSLALSEEPKESTPDSDLLNDSAILVCSAAVGSAYRDRAAPCIESHRAYCRVHGYQYRLETNQLVEERVRPLPWTKILLLQRLLANSRHEALVWLDADTLITNDLIRVEDWLGVLGEREILLTRDSNGVINTGVMVMKNTPWVRQFLKKVYAQQDFIHHPMWENAALEHLYGSESSIRQRCYLLDASRSFLMNAYPYNFEPASWLVHFAGHGDFTKLAELYAPYSNRSTEIDLERQGVYFRENRDYEDQSADEDPNQAPWPFRIYNRESNTFLNKTESIIKINGCDCQFCRRFLQEMKRLSSSES